MSITRFIYFAALLNFLLCPLAYAGPGESIKPGDADFKKKIKPFFENYCFACHDEETKLSLIHI